MDFVDAVGEAWVEGSRILVYMLLVLLFVIFVIKYLTGVIVVFFLASIIVGIIQVVTDVVWILRD